MPKIEELRPSKHNKDQDDFARSLGFAHWNHYQNSLDHVETVFHRQYPSGFGILQTGTKPYSERLEHGIEDNGNGKRRSR